MKSFFQFLFGLGIFTFWLWGCENNDGLVAIGIPVAVFCYAASKGKDDGGHGSSEPRVAPYDADGGG